MKSAKLLNIFIAGVLLATFAAGCKKNPKNITNIPNQRTTLGGGEPPGPIVPPGPNVDPRGMGDIADPINGRRNTEALAAQTIYFDFDRSAIKPSEQGKLDAVATYVKSTLRVQLLVEGHCDERGTEEYNRSLG